MSSITTIEFLRSEWSKQLRHKHKFNPVNNPIICPPQKHIIPLYFPSSDQSKYPIYCDKTFNDYEYLFINNCI